MDFDKCVMDAEDQYTNKQIKEMFKQVEKKAGFPVTDEMKLWLNLR